MGVYYLLGFGVVVERKCKFNSEVTNNMHFGLHNPSNLIMQIVFRCAIALFFCHFLSGTKTCQAPLPSITSQVDCIANEQVNCRLFTCSPEQTDKENIFAIGWCALTDADTYTPTNTQTTTERDLLKIHGSSTDIFQ